MGSWRTIGLYVSFALFLYGNIVANANANIVRGPCPMMNTLANHGFLPHDGTNITKANAIHALGSALHFSADLASIMWEQAIIANPEPNATFFTLCALPRDLLPITLQC